MIKPDQIPDEVVAALQRAHGFHISPQALATALNAWPDMECRPTFEPSRIILPLKDVQSAGR